MVCMMQMSPVKIDGAKRQLFSLSQSHNIRLHQAPADGDTPKAAATRTTLSKDPKQEPSSRQQQHEEGGTQVGKARPTKRKHKEELGAKASTQSALEIASFAVL